MIRKMFPIPVEHSRDPRKWQQKGGDHDPPERNLQHSPLGCFWNRKGIGEPQDVDSSAAKTVIPANNAILHLRFTTERRWTDAPNLNISRSPIRSIGRGMDLHSMHHLLLVNVIMPVKALHVKDNTYRAKRERQRCKGI
ncbi:MAG: hypothetical protein ABSH08_16620 [Tepidisphaeraceae bacterium]|jgi:hypothetical protein